MNFAEFFAGVGLIREGLSSQGWECVWANDISADKRETYVSNYGSDHFSLADVWDIASDISRIPDDTFLYTASFPCTDLSVAGERAGLEGKHSGTLNAVIEIIRQKKKLGKNPKVVLLENVQGFLTSHKGKDISNTVSLFTDLGYYIDILELDAIDFTPQSRPRVFLIAVDSSIAKSVMKIKRKNSILDKWWLIFDQNPALRSERVRNIILMNENLNWGIFDIQPPSGRNMQLAEIIEVDILDDSSLWWSLDRKDHLLSQMSDRHKAKLNAMIRGGSYTYGTVYRRVRKGKSMAELRSDGVAGCLRTPRGGSSKQILVRAGLSEWSVRLLTPREYARLQGVREDYILPNNANKGYFAMGDAVCVQVIDYISREVLTPIFNHSEKIVYNK